MDTIVGEPTSSSAGTSIATFTKWLIGEGPEMAGTAGGVVGDGTFRGKVLNMNPGPTTTIEAMYGFHGSKRDFTALVHVEQTGLEAVISGVVIDGWGKGQSVSGSYSEIKCAHDGVTTDCWQGRLEIAAGA
jgi:hypothetical protein